MAFAQLTFRDSLRDIAACLRAQPTKLYHLGIRGNVSRSALADANEDRDWRIYAEYAQPSFAGLASSTPTSRVKTESVCPLFTDLICPLV